jgi:hypothetical protein
MQKEPNMALLKYFCCRDPQAFLLCDQNGRCDLVAENSESVEFLQTILQIDPGMTKRFSGMLGATPIGLLSRRPHFPIFNETMFCLIEVDSSTAIIYDGACQCIESYGDTLCDDILPKLGVERTLTLFLTANPNITNHNDFQLFRWTCKHSRGEVGVAVLSLLLYKKSSGVKALDISNGFLPIHYAASNSSLDVLILLHKAYLESPTMLTNNGLIYYILLEIYIKLVAGEWLTLMI